MTGTKLALSPIAYIEAEREKLLRRRGRQSVRALVRRLIAEDTGNIGLAAEIARIGEDRAVILPRYRSAAEERELLVGILDGLLLLVPFTPREAAALDAFLALVDAWAEPVN